MSIITEPKSGGIVATKEMANTLGRVERAVAALGRHDEIRERLVAELATSRAALDRERRKVGRGHGEAWRERATRLRERAGATPETETITQWYLRNDTMGTVTREARLESARDRLIGLAGAADEYADQLGRQFAETSAEWNHGERLESAIMGVVPVPTDEGE